MSMSDQLKDKISDYCFHFYPKKEEEKMGTLKIHTNRNEILLHILK